VNEVSTAIKTWRSVRSYLAKRITTEELKTVLKAGVFAPSGMNTQPWFFSVLQNPGLIARVNDWIIEEAAYVRSNPKAKEIASIKNAALFGLTIGYPATPPEPAQPRRQGVFAVLV